MILNVTFLKHFIVCPQLISLLMCNAKCVAEQNMCGSRLINCGHTIYRYVTLSHRIVEGLEGRRISATPCMRVIRDLVLVE